MSRAERTRSRVADMITSAEYSARDAPERLTGTCSRHVG